MAVPPAHAPDGVDWSHDAIYRFQEGVGSLLPRLAAVHKVLYRPTQERPGVSTCRGLPHTPRIPNPDQAAPFSGSAEPPADRGFAEAQLAQLAHAVELRHIAVDTFVPRQRQ